MNQKNKAGTALVTGAAKRIGQAIALELASLGYNIALHYHHSQKEAETTAEQIRQNGVQCTLFSCNLSNEKETLQLVGKVFKKFPSLNLLVNSASIFEKSGFDVKDLKLFDLHFTTNLKTPFILSSEFVRLCKKGQIINLLDTHIVKNRTSYTAYLLTKKSLAEMTKLAAVSFAPHIRVNGIAPGLILPAKGDKAAALDRMAQNIPLKQKGNLTTIRQSVRFLVENDYVTGQFIFADGGEHL